MSRGITGVVAVALLGALGCSSEKPEELPVGAAKQMVVNGEQATTQHIYATVALFDLNLQAQFCTGTLIAPNVVVTAAHCVVDANGNPTIIPFDLAILSNVLNTFQATNDDAYFVSDIIAHPGYPGGIDPNDIDGMGQADDIAIVILETPITDQAVAPVLAEPSVDSYVFPGSSNVRVTGYGINDLNTGEAGILYTAETPYQKRNDHEMFAGLMNGPDSCSGDSGGPAYVTLENNIYLFGATSRGTVNSNVSCGDGGIYTIVGAYDSWLQSESNNAYGGAVDPSNASTSATTTAASGPSSSSSSATGGGEGGGNTASSSTSGAGGNQNDEDDGGETTTVSCSTTGGSAGDMALPMLAVLGLGLFAGRRRRD